MNQNSRTQRRLRLSGGLLAAGVLAAAALQLTGASAAHAAPVTTPGCGDTITISPSGIPAAVTPNVTRQGATTVTPTTVTPTTVTPTAEQARGTAAPHLAAPHPAAPHAAASDDYELFVGSPLITNPLSGTGYNFRGDEELFARACDGTVWHDYATPGQGSGWSGWHTLNGATTELVSNIAIGYNQHGNEEMFARASDGTVWHDYSTPGQGTGWSGWQSLGGATTPLTNDINVGYNIRGDEELFAVDSDGVAWHDYATPGVGTGWSGWSSFASQDLDFTSNITIIYADGGGLFDYDAMVARESDGSIWIDPATPGSGTGWAGWTSLGSAGATLASDVAVGYNSSGLAELFARAGDGTVWHDFQTDQTTSGWSGWLSLGGATTELTSNVTIGYNSRGDEEMFARASDGSVWHDWSTPGVAPGWTGWHTLGSAGTELNSDLSLGYNGNDDEELFARATDGTVWHQLSTPGQGTGWTTWLTLGGAGTTLASNVG